MIMIMVTDVAWTFLQGMCSGSAASFAPAAILGPGVCAVAVRAGFLHINSVSGPNQLWLDKLHVTIAPTAASDTQAVTEPTLAQQDAGHLFMTNVTFHGRERKARAFYLSNADMRSPELHAEGEPSPSSLPLPCLRSSSLLRLQLQPLPRASLTWLLHSALDTPSPHGTHHHPFQQEE